MEHIRPYIYGKILGYPIKSFRGWLEPAQSVLKALDLSVIDITSFVEQQPCSGFCSRCYTCRVDLFFGPRTDPTEQNFSTSGDVRELNYDHITAARHSECTVHGISNELHQ